MARRALVEAMLTHEGTTREPRAFPEIYSAGGHAFSDDLSPSPFWSTGSYRKVPPSRSGSPSS